MTDQTSDRRRALEEKLRSVEEIFLREMRERGFEPDQAENVALPTSLARLYTQREALKTELDELKGGTE
jgi:pentatricopeptide repeat protein